MLSSRDSYEFMRAIEEGKFKEAEQLLAQENKVIQTLPVVKVTALHLATWKGNIDFVKTLINRGADVNDADIYGRTALFHAAHCGHVTVARRLLECGANINAQASSPKLNFRSDEYIKNLEMFSVTYKLPIPQRWDRTPLHQAVQNNHADVVRDLIKNGACVNMQDEDFLTPLLLAGDKVYRHKINEVRKFFEIVTVLVSAGAYADNIHEMIELLFRAIKLDSVETIELLLTKVCARSLQEQYKNVGTTPFHIAAEEGNINALMTLCNGLTYYDIDMRDNMNRTALHESTFRGSRKCAKLLINHGADLTATDKYGCTAAYAIFRIREPVRLLTDILDSYVHMTDNSLERNKHIEVDFKILIPVHQKDQMAVLIAIINAATEIWQMRILEHPLIETFLRLKWARLRTFFLFLMLAHLSFAVCVSVFALLFMDNSTINFLLILWILHVCSSCFFIHNLKHLLLEPKHFRQSLKHGETWLSILCAIIALATTIGSKFTNCDEEESEKRQCAQWILHCLCFAILLSWMQTMLFIGRFPMWGYYAHMFFTVLKNVKIFLIFGFLIVGVALSFATVFSGKEHFGTFWKALVSTVLMMISKYEYTDVHNNNTSTEYKESEQGFLSIARVIFFSCNSFIILTSIVLINLMTGLATSDIQVLKAAQYEVYLRQLVKQAEFIAQLEKLILHEIGLIHLKVLTYLRSHISTKITLSFRPKYFQLQFCGIPTHLMKALNLLVIETSERRMMDNNGFNNFSESIPTQSNYNSVSLIFEYNNQRHWVKIVYPYSYEMFEAKAKETFSELNDKQFKFYDEKKAILTGEFLIEHIQFSGRGAIITIELDRPVIHDFDYLTTPTLSSSSNITLTDTSEEDEAPGTSSQNTHNLPILHSQVSKKGEIVTNEIIKKIILESPCGNDIFEEYNTKGFLSDRNRRRMINIVVNQMLILKKELKRSLTSLDKCQFAKSIVEIFPKLRDPETALGYESFYDPVTKTGYLANRLSNVRRGIKRKRTYNEESENNRNVSNTNITEDENETLTQAEIDDIILFLKSATQDQKSQIISKHKDIFQYRRKFCLNINFFDIFPRFLDTPELIEEEYKLLFPKYDDFFLKEFSKYCEIILRVFSKIDHEIHPSVDKLEEAWDKHTRAILALCRLLPPTAREKNKAAR